jgi:hypothetical protein
LRYKFPSLFKLAWRKTVEWWYVDERLASYQFTWAYGQLCILLELLAIGDSLVWWGFNIWKQRSDRTYSAASAYSACFYRRIPQPVLAAAWDVSIEGKINFFSLATSPDSVMDCC